MDQAGWRRLVRPSWHRANMLAVAIPAVWAIWALVLDQNIDELIIAVGASGWLFITLRTWSWYESDNPQD